MADIGWAMELLQSDDEQSGSGIHLTLKQRTPALEVIWCHFTQLQSDITAANTKIAAILAAIVETCRRADLRFSPALIAEPLRPFLPAPVDPLVEALREVHAKGYYETEEAFAHDLRQALAARGLDVTAKGDA